MRTAQIHRKTKETDISCSLNLAGSGVAKVSTGIGFLDHMLEAFARHSRADLELECTGDLHIDQHHTVEDVGIVIGQAVLACLGDQSGIERFGHMHCPLDEALVRATVDISGRPFLHYGLAFTRPQIGALDSSLIREFFGGFVLHARWTVHLDCIRGENDHHIAEAAFKAFARAARMAWLQSGFSDIPSTKGVL